MVFQNNILSGVGGQAAGVAYVIDYSCRFNQPDSPYLSRTISGTPTDASKGVIGGWFKRSNLEAAAVMWDCVGQAYEIAMDGTGVTPSRRYEIGGVDNGVQLFSSTQLFRDPTAWFQVVVSYDSDESAAIDRSDIYINGIKMTSFSYEAWTQTSLGEAWGLTTDTINTVIGTAEHDTTITWDGYMAQQFLLDGVSIQNGDHAITAFGEYDTNGVWRPVDVSGLTFGTNGWLLDFADSSDLGNDVSGNSNDYTSSGLAANDQMLDTPTTNYCTWSPIWKPNGYTSPMIYSNGNLQCRYISSTDGGHPANMFVSSGKWYFEIESGSNYDFLGIVSDTCVAGGNMKGHQAWVAGNFSTFSKDYAYAYEAFTGNSVSPVAEYAYGDTFADGDVIGVALDLENDALWYSKNDTWQNSATIEEIEAGTTTNAAESGSLTGIRWGPAWCFSATHSTHFLNCGQTAFAGTAPSGFNKINTANLATPTILDGTAHFQTTLYTGDGSVRSIDQTGNSTFQPDMVWIKNRSAADNHMVIDAARGVTKEVNTNNGAEEITDANGLTSFDSDGFGLGTGAGGYNDNTESFVAWQWLAGGGAGSSNTVGSTNTITTTVNTTAGISIGTYTGTGAVATIGHGLGVAPGFITVKELDDGTNQWITYHVGNNVPRPAEDGYLAFNESQGGNDYSIAWNDTAPTSTVFTVGTQDDVNDPGNTYVCYVFAEIEGFSRFYNYIGNGLADGPTVTMGFKPAFVIIKAAQATGNWVMYDSQRSPYNEIDDQLLVNEATAETTGSEEIDFLANGFKIRTADSDVNTASGDYVYLAFAEYPFGGEDVTPATAF